MGACSFTTSARGKSMNDAHKNAVEDARDEYGHQQGYSGTIASVSGYRDMTAEFKRSKKSINQFIDDTIENANKWGPCLAICVEEPITNKNKIKTQVINNVVKGTKKWVLKYVVTSRYGDGGEIAVCDTKGDAVKKAREYTEKTQSSTIITMEKRMQGDKKVAEVVYKKSDKEKDGKYIFYGYAPE